MKSVWARNLVTDQKLALEDKTKKICFHWGSFERDNLPFLSIVGLPGNQGVKHHAQFTELWSVYGWEPPTLGHQFIAAGKEKKTKLVFNYELILFFSTLFNWLSQNQNQINQTELIKNQQNIGLLLTLNWKLLCYKTNGKCQRTSCPHPSLGASSGWGLGRGDNWYFYLFHVFLFLGILPPNVIWIIPLLCLLRLVGCN